MRIRIRTVLRMPRVWMWVRGVGQHFPYGYPLFHPPLLPEHSPTRMGEYGCTLRCICTRTPPNSNASRPPPGGPGPSYANPYALLSHHPRLIFPLHFRRHRLTMDHINTPVGLSHTMAHHSRSEPYYSGVGLGSVAARVKTGADAV